jgi:hypothetical protein
MRFMVIVKANKDSEAGVLPSTDMLAAMNEFNAGLVKDGVLLAAEGLQASSKGARMKFAGGKPAVTDGPFAETKELIAGFWLIQAKSKEEVIERYSRCPFANGEEIEIRQVFEADDFGDALPPEACVLEERLRAQGRP